MISGEAYWKTETAWEEWLLGIIFISAYRNRQVIKNKIHRTIEMLTRYSGRNLGWNYLWIIFICNWQVMWNNRLFFGNILKSSFIISRLLYLIFEPEAICIWTLSNDRKHFFVSIDYLDHSKSFCTAGYDVCSLEQNWKTGNRDW